MSAVRTTWSRARAGVALAAVGALLLSGCGSIYDVPLPGGAKVGSDPITVHAEFRDVLDLVPQSTVKVDDVTVGRVTGIKLKGYTADVTLLLPKDVDLPDNAEASIRQTSLLGEKFVSLAPPSVNPSSNKLGTGDTIPLSRTGRNPEVEEVLGALSLLLNGGGVGQLKTIATELNNATGGREEDVRSVLNQLDEFVGQLDQNKAAIVSAIESLNRLAVSLRRQDGTIKLALDDLPAAIASVNGQRADLVKTLKALQNLSGVGVRVISQSKTATINSLKDLSPVLDRLADSGSALAKSIQVSLTYPFIDQAVGFNPQTARNLHLGDYVNLDASLNLSLSDLPIPTPSIPVPSQLCQLTDAVKQRYADALAQAKKVAEALPTATPTQVTKIVDAVNQAIKSASCEDPLSNAQLAQDLVDAIAKALGIDTSQVTKILNGLGSTLGGLTGGTKGGTKSGSGSGGLGGVLGGLGLGRAGTDYTSGKKGDALNGPTGTADTIGYNSTLGALLLQGVDK